MVCSVNVESVDHIICAIFNRINEQWKSRTLDFSYRLLDITRRAERYPNSVIL
jgi:hypothetical protein